MPPDYLSSSIKRQDPVDMLSLDSILISAALLIAPLTTAFSGNFEVTNVVVSSPSQANSNSTEGTFVQRKLPLSSPSSYHLQSTRANTQQLNSRTRIPQKLALPIVVSNGQLACNLPPPTATLATIPLSVSRSSRGKVSTMCPSSSVTNTSITGVSRTALNLTSAG